MNSILNSTRYFIARAWIIFTITIGNIVISQGGGGGGGGNADPLAPVTAFICSVGRALSGPIAIAIGLVLIAAGGIAVAVGGRRAMGTVLWGIVGITIASSAVALTTSLLGTGTC